MDDQNITIPQPPIPAQATTFIYALTDPRNGHVRYVGKSNSPTQRYKSHIRDGKSSRKGAWVRELLANGLKPQLVILEEVIASRWEATEREWITFHAETITNDTPGGDGVLRHSEETKELIRLSLRWWRRAPKAPPLPPPPGRPLPLRHKSKRWGKDGTKGIYSRLCKSGIRYHAYADGHRFLGSYRSFEEASAVRLKAFMELADGE